MPTNPEAFAEMVVMTVKSALAPLQARLAASEQSNLDLRERVQELLTLRDRVTVIETKATMPLPEPKPFDASPLLERIAATETKLSTMGDVRDRITVMETKAATLAAPVADLPAVDLSPVTGRLAELANDVVTVRERLAAVEVRAQIPGPAGKDGLDGKHGQNGRDGTDGLGFDDLSVEFDGDRTIELKMQRGAQVKSFPIVLPFMRQQGVYTEGKSYVRGDVVTWGGSQWHCEAETATKPGDGSKNWTLVVKRGRDGKDGRDAATVPVVSIGGKVNA